MITPTSLKLDSLKRFLVDVYNSDLSDFYRVRWKERFSPQEDFAVLEDLRRAPLITKTDLSISPFSRLYVPLGDVEFVRSTSGTTGGDPLIIFHHRTNPKTFENKILPESKRALLFMTTIYSALQHYFIQKALYPEKVVIAAEYKNLNNAAVTAAKCGIDGLAGPPRNILDLLGKLSEIYDLAKIKEVAIWGDAVFDDQCERLRQLLPHVTPDFIYACTEGGYIGYRCEYLKRNSDPQLFHPRKNIIIELLDEEGVPILSPGVAGGIVITTKKRILPTPLIRYKTDDVGSFMAATCPCEEPVFRICGKVQYYEVCFNGLRLCAGDIENALRRFQDAVSFNNFRVSIAADRSRCRITASLLARREVDASKKREIQDAFLSIPVVASDKAAPGLLKDFVSAVDIQLVRAHPFEIKAKRLQLTG